MLLFYHKPAIFLESVRRDLHHDIHITAFFDNSYTTFLEMRFSPYANFDQFSTIFEIQLNTFSRRFRAVEDTLGLDSSITPIVFPESPVEMSKF